MYQSSIPSFGKFFGNKIITFMFQSLPSCHLNIARNSSIPLLITTYSLNKTLTSTYCDILGVNNITKFANPEIFEHYFGNNVLI